LGVGVGGFGFGGWGLGVTGFEVKVEVRGLGCGVPGSRFQVSGFDFWMQGLIPGSVGLFRGGLVFKAHRLLYHSTLGLRIIKKRRRRPGSV